MMFRLSADKAFLQFAYDMIFVTQFVEESLIQIPSIQEAKINTGGKNPTCVL